MRLETVGPDGRMQSVALPFDWAKSQTGDAVARVRAIYRLVGEGHSLKTAALVAAGEAHLLNLSIAATLQRRGLGSELLRFMLQLARDQGTAFIVVTHDEALAARCTRISLARTRCGLPWRSSGL